MHNPTPKLKIKNLKMIIRRLRTSMIPGTGQYGFGVPIGWF